MNPESLLPYHTAHSGWGVGMFNTPMGKLQRQLHKGEYDIFKYAPIFESDFTQITKRGEVTDVHNRVRVVTVGIASTSPILPLPDVMLLARLANGYDEHGGRGQATKGKGRKGAKTLELTRLLPLKFVRISIHDREKQQLRLKFATGRSFYLQLCPTLDAREDLFTYWEKLIYLLRPPMDGYSNTYAVPADDMLCIPVFEEENRRSPAGSDFHGNADEDQVSIRSIHEASEVAEATSAAFAGGEGTRQDAYKPDVAAASPKLAGLNREAAAGPNLELAAAVAAGEAAGAAAVSTGGFAAGIAAGSGAGALSVAIASSATAVAGAAAKGSGGSRTNLAIAGTVGLSRKSRNVALADGAKTPAFTSDSSTSLRRGAGRPATRAGTEGARKPGAGKAESALLSDAQSEGAASEQAAKQPRKSRRERRERRNKERTFRGPCRRTAPDSPDNRHKAAGDKTHSPDSRHKAAGDKTHSPDCRHKAAGDKTDRKDSSRSLSGHRAAAAREDKDKARSPGGGRRASHKGTSPSPNRKESRASHKSGPSLPTDGQDLASKTLGRIASFLRKVKAKLTSRTTASPRGGDTDVLTKTTDRSGKEAIIEASEKCGGLGSTERGTSDYNYRHRPSKPLSETFLTAV